MQSIYVLLMVFATASSQGGISVAQQEFSSRENCEAARTALSKSTTVSSGGCFKK
jgi:hypothetical protein